jgi:hypothetical protein
VNNDYVNSLLNGLALFARGHHTADCGKRSLSVSPFHCIVDVNYVKHPNKLEYKCTVELLP